MTSFRIPANENYLQALGRAFYNFTYLEKIVKDIIIKLNNGQNVIKEKATAGEIKNILKGMNFSGHPAEADLNHFVSGFESTVNIRNRLLHANPYTTIDGDQEIIYKDNAWPIEDVYNAAQEFENLAILGSDIFHNKI